MIQGEGEFGQSGVEKSRGTSAPSHTAHQLSGWSPRLPQYPLDYTKYNGLLLVLERSNYAVHCTCKESPIN